MRPKKTLILDFDETLVHSWENPRFLDVYDIYSNPALVRSFHPLGQPQITYSMLLQLSTGPTKIWGLTRPHLHEFLEFAHQYFDNVLGWSAGLPSYVNEINDQVIVGSGLPSPKLLWARDRTPNYQGMYHKPISDIIQELNKRPYSPLEIDPKWTVIVDDKQHTFMLNPSSGILIPPYHPGKHRPDRIPLVEDLLDRSDDRLLQLKNWFERPEVRNCPDVTVLDKTRIFT